MYSISILPQHAWQKTMSVSYGLARDKTACMTRHCWAVPGQKYPQHLIRTELVWIMIGGMIVIVWAAVLRAVTDAEGKCLESDLDSHLQDNGASFAIQNFRWLQVHMHASEIALPHLPTPRSCRCGCLQMCNWMNSRISLRSHGYLDEIPSSGYECVYYKFESNTKAFKFET